MLPVLSQHTRRWRLVQAEVQNLLEKRQQHSRQQQQALQPVDPDEYIAYNACSLLALWLQGGDVMAITETPCSVPGDKCCCVAIMYVKFRVGCPLQQQYITAVATCCRLVAAALHQCFAKKSDIVSAVSQQNITGQPLSQHWGG